MQTQLRKPWLDQNGLPLSDSKLKLASKRWDQKTWEEYLSWFECPLTELLLPASSYNELASRMEESCFSLSTSDERDNIKVCTDELLAELTPKQITVIKMIYWQGKSEREISKHLGISRSTTKVMKKSALARIKKNIVKEGWPQIIVNNTTKLAVG